VLYVVAGYPASGKSAALGLAAKGRASLFPPPIQRGFMKCLPEEVLAELTPTAEKLRRRMWLTYVDGAAFAQIEPKPQHAVYHLDMLLHLIVDIRPRGVSDFTDEAVRRSFEAFFAGPFCAPYPERAITTLYPDFKVLRSRWRDRMQKIKETDNPMWVANMRMKDQIIMGRYGLDIYRKILRIWLDIANEASVGTWLVRGGKNGNGLPYRLVTLAG
jgi:hypothetical protein